MSIGVPPFSPMTNVSAYGLAPSEESPRIQKVEEFFKQLPTDANPGWDPSVQTLGTFGPCPKCRRHCRENECPFCYADSLKPEALSAELAKVTAERDALRDRLSLIESRLRMTVGRLRDVQRALVGVDELLQKVEAP